MAGPESTSQDGTSSSISLGAKDLICRAVTPSEAPSDTSVSYISKSQSVALSTSDSIVENHVVIMPASGDDKPNGQELASRLVDLGVDCGLAVPLSYFATAATCGGTVVSLGTAAPLCVLSTAGAVTASIKCGHAIGKMVDYAEDPSLLNEFERNQMWKYYETGVDFVDTVSNIAGAYDAMKNLGKLKSLTSKYGKNVFKRYSAHESKIVYQEFAKMLADVTSKQGARQWANARGFTPRYTPQILNKLLEKTIFDAGLASINTYDNVVETNKRHQFTTAIPERTIIKDTLQSAITAPNGPGHTTITFQQFRPR